jgi:carboxypeptidase T
MSHFVSREFKSMKKTFLLSILGIVWAASLFPAQTYPQKRIISLVKSRDVLAELKGMNLDLLMEKDDRIYAVAGSEELFELGVKNIPYRIESPKLSPPEHRNYSIQSGVNGEFHSYVELEKDLMAMADAYPDVAKVEDIGDSLEGRNIYALKISDNVWAEENEAAVIFLGCHHAREWISLEVPFLLGKYLVENYGADPEVKRLVDSSEIWIIPLVNPDGLEYSIYFYRYWRKNRRDNGDGTFGVDLNRNYGYEWGYDNSGSSPDPASEIYRGPAPFSEPEVQAVRDFFGQRKFQALISYHSFAQVILYPWGYKAAPSDQNALLARIAERMSDLMEPVNGRYYDPERSGASFYLTNGDTTDWSFGVYGIPSYTIELPPNSELTGEFFNAESDIQPIFEENLPAMIYLIDWSINKFESVGGAIMKSSRHGRERSLKIK